jgi:hypothetical protein
MKMDNQLAMRLYKNPIVIPGFYAKTEYSSYA